MIVSLVLELLFALALVVLTLTVWRLGRRGGFDRQPGFRWILAGFGLILVGGLVDISDHFPALGRFVVLGQTPGQAVLEKVLGFLAGVIVLTIGLGKWLPVVAARNLAAREAEAQRTLAERKLQNFFTLSLELLCIADLDGFFQVLSPSFTRLLGWSEDELKARPFLDFVHPDDIEVTLAEMARLETGVDTLYFENRYRCRDGSYRWLAWNAHPEPEDGLLYAAAHDISSMKESQRQLAAARDEAEASSRAKTDFLAKMSHELRTPLNSVIGFSNVLLEQESVGDEDQERLFLERIRANGTHLLALINDVLDISQVEAKQVRLELVPVDVVALARDCLSHLEPRLEGSTVRLTAEVPRRDVEPLIADRRRLRQVLLNLLDNAIKFTEEGVITLRVIARRRGGRALRIEVEDSGPGIAPEDLPRVFDAFQQVGQGLSRRHQGTGLGLSISASLCRLMGFDLRAVSEVGRGTTFTIMLDTERQSGEFATTEVVTLADDAVLRDQGLAHLSGHRVLVVDDQSEARELISHLLSELGLKVLEADSIGEAVEVAAESRPSILIVDLLMPTGAVDGVEGVARLAQEPSLMGVPIIVASVVGDEYRNRLPQAAAILSIPVDRQELIETITRLLPA